MFGLLGSLLPGAVLPRARFRCDDSYLLQPGEIAVLDWAVGLNPNCKTQRHDQLGPAFSDLTLYPHRDGTSALTPRGRLTTSQEKKQMRSALG